MSGFPARPRASSRGAIVCGWFALVTVLTAGAASSRAAKAVDGPSSSFGHLTHREGGPDWTFDSVAASVPAGPAMAIEPGKPIPRVTDAAAATRAALQRLRGNDAQAYDVAFRLTAATAGQTKDGTALRLLTLLQHHGVGTRMDKGGAVRTATELVRAGDGDACAFVGRAAPKVLWSTARAIASLRQLRKLDGPATVRVTLPIVANDGGEMSVGPAGEEEPLRVLMATRLDDAKTGRVASLVGVWGEGVFTAYAGEVPKPDVAFEWELVRRPMRGGEWQVQTVKVAVHNRGVQPVKSAKFRVRCVINRGKTNDHTVNANAPTIPPGETRAVDVNFEMFNYQYLDGVAAPKVEVTLDAVEW